jgi:hypothetical protein
MSGLGGGVLVRKIISLDTICLGSEAVSKMTYTKNVCLESEPVSKTICLEDICLGPEPVSKTIYLKDVCLSSEVVSKITYLKNVCLVSEAVSKNNLFKNTSLAFKSLTRHFTRSQVSDLILHGCAAVLWNRAFTYAMVPKPLMYYTSLTHTGIQCCYVLKTKKMISMSSSKATLNACAPVRPSKSTQRNVWQLSKIRNRARRHLWVCSGGPKYSNVTT